MEVPKDCPFYGMPTAPCWACIHYNKCLFECTLGSVTASQTNTVRTNELGRKDSWKLSKEEYIDLINKKKGG